MAATLGFRTQIYSADGRDITFDVLGIAAPENSDPLTLFCNTEDELTEETNAPVSFSQICNFLNLK